MYCTFSFADLIDFDLFYAQSSCTNEQSQMGKGELHSYSNGSARALSHSRMDTVLVWIFTVWMKLAWKRQTKMNEMQNNKNPILFSISRSLTKHRAIPLVLHSIMISINNHNNNLKAIYQAEDARARERRKMPCCRTTGSSSFVSCAYETWLKNFGNLLPLLPPSSSLQSFFRLHFRTFLLPLLLLPLACHLAPRFDSIRFGDRP